MQIWTWNGTGHGTFDLAFPFGTNIVNRHTRVVCSICELSQPAGGPLDYPFIGNATMRVLNVAPQDNGNVYTRIEIDFSTNLNFRVTFFMG